MSDTDEEDDSYIDSLVAEAIGPLRPLLPPEEQRAMEQSLRDAITDDPELAALYAAARPRKARKRSGEEEAHPNPAGETQDPAPLRRKGGAA